jgi:hypothetical protein
MTLSGRLLVDAARNAVFIREAGVGPFALDGVDAGVQRQLAKAAKLVTEQIVTFEPAR